MYIDMRERGRRSLALLATVSYCLVDCNHLQFCTYSWRERRAGRGGRTVGSFSFQSGFHSTTGDWRFTRQVNDRLDDFVGLLWRACFGEEKVEAEYQVHEQQRAQMRNNGPSMLESGEGRGTHADTQTLGTLCMHVGECGGAPVAALVRTWGAEP
ncbi:uncharacterized protein B0I36DRAFT_28304 [Microdochium trichocladiopsis]|uniref:Uncharacterized protein n=1 Tax=Microdochium trichocladiopsis TaxID=1682393 RepID=A0A9P8XVQ1_9PEZI|nr:uncharacterized protein B0I36DRAFT_28304 [Microdochium trichocladiopsis]KAH7021048.1 hypothetical protein B0I36DRAFT_28304 [Microdochium trichocladiopsis]